MQIQESNTKDQKMEIDLKEFIRIIANSKKTLISFTLAFTIFAGIYAYIKTPIYEATALIQVGSYKLKNNKVVPIESTSSLMKVLYTKHILIENSVKSDLQEKIISITIPKKTNSFIEIKAEAISNELAKKEILRVVKLITNKHNVVISDYQEQLTLEVENLKRKIESISQVEGFLLREQINKYKIILLQLINDEQSAEKNIKKIENSNPVLALVKHGEKNTISINVLNIRNLLNKLEASEVDLRTTKIYEKLEAKKSIELLLEPYNLANTHIVGAIVTNDYPIRPMRKLIIILSFITGLLLSIFVIFMKEMFKED